MTPVYSACKITSYGLYSSYGKFEQKFETQQVVDPKSAKKIQGLLENDEGPSTSTVPSNERSQEVSTIVSKILASTSKATSSKTPAQKFVVMPVLHAPMPHGSQRPSFRYMLVNTRQAQPTYSAFPASRYPAPYFGARVPNATVPVILRQRSLIGTANLTPKQSCQTVVRTAADTVRQWLDRNRDILSKTLVNVAEKLNVATIVTILLLKNQDAYNEHVCMKWVGIALMLLTKYRIKEAVGPNNRWAIPTVLAHMWNNLKSFFTVYEGCLQLVKESRKHSPIALTNAARDLQIEDQAFEDMLGHIFLAYTKSNGEELPEPTNLRELDDFIAGLNETVSPPPRTKSNRGAHIKSVLTTGQKTSADITTRYKRHKVVCTDADEAPSKAPKRSPQ